MHWRPHLQNNCPKFFLLNAVERLLVVHKVQYRLHIVLSNFVDKLPHIGHLFSCDSSLCESCLLQRDLGLHDGIQPVIDDFQEHFASLEDERYGSIVHAVFWWALFLQGDIRRPAPVFQPFFSFLYGVTLLEDHFRRLCAGCFNNLRWSGVLTRFFVFLLVVDGFNDFI